MIHNPASNGKLGSGRMRFDEMLNAGVRVGLATDGSGSNDTQNMFEAMRLAGYRHNRNDSRLSRLAGARGQCCARRHREARMRSALARARDDRARRFADLVMLNPEIRFRSCRSTTSIKQIVYCENGMSVTDVMIDGRWVLKAASS